MKTIQYQKMFKGFSALIGILGKVRSLRSANFGTKRMAAIGFATLLLAGRFLLLAGENGKTDSGNVMKRSSDKPDVFTFKVPVDVVVVSIVATDKNGNPVKDLTVDDFKVYEDGKPVPIHTFSLESYNVTQPAGSNPSSSSQEGAQAKPANEEPTQRRMVTFFLDDVTNEKPEDLLSAKQALVKYLETDLQPGDLVSLQTASGRASLEFTSDKELLVQTAIEFVKKVIGERMTRVDCPDLTDLQAAQIHSRTSDRQALQVGIAEAAVCQMKEDDLNGPNGEAVLQQLTSNVQSVADMLFEENQFKYRRLLTSLRAFIRNLKHFEGRKTLVLLSDGLLSDDIRYELQEIVNAALRTGVVIDTLDVRGLYTEAPDISKTVVVSRRSDLAATLAAKPLMRMEDIRRQDEAMRQLSSETGGIHVANTNDLVGGLKKVFNTDSSYYVLSYASPVSNSKADGRYHKIKVEVSRPGLRLSYRQGYYAPKEQLTFERRKKEDIIEALHAPGNLNEIPIQLSYNYFQLDESHYQLALLTRVSMRGMKFVEEDARFRNEISLVVVAFDENDRYVDGLEKSMQLNLSDPSYKTLIANGFTSKISINVPPGRYQIRAVVREGVNTKIGSIRKTIEVP
ncbi:MAG: VWA domain-containing protein [Terriglobia bacterium]